MGTFKSVTIALLLVAAFITPPNTSLAENSIRITTQENIVSIHQGSSALLRYGYRNVPYKPCMQQLFTPDGINVLRDSPADHQHHHALMYAVSVDGLNLGRAETTRTPDAQEL